MTGFSGGWPPKIEWGPSFKSPDFPPPIPEAHSAYTLSGIGTTKGTKDKGKPKKDAGRNLNGSGGRKSGRTKGKKSR